MEKTAATASDFSFHFSTAKPASEVYNHLLNPKNWWVGFYDETITGESEKTGDVFEFLAGGGVHYSKHCLTEASPNNKIVWAIIDSTLSFLDKTDEWVGTKIRFDLAEDANGTQVTFTHEGLTPKFECYGNCSSAWTQYLESLEAHMK